MDNWIYVVKLETGKQFYFNSPREARRFARINRDVVQSTISYQVAA